MLLCFSGKYNGRREVWRLLIELCRGTTVDAGNARSARKRNLWIERERKMFGRERKLLEEEKREKVVEVSLLRWTKAIEKVDDGRSKRGEASVFKRDHLLGVLIYKQCNKSNKSRGLLLFVTVVNHSRINKTRHRSDMLHFIFSYLANFYKL